MYVDLYLLLNLFIDFFILLTVSYILRRKTSINRLLLGSFIGSLGSLIVNNFVIIIVSIFMSLVSFNYINIKYTIKNIIYIFLISIMLGGTLLLLKINNYLLLLILIPIILYLYLKEIKTLKSNYNHYYDVEIVLNKTTLYFKGFLDTGNKLVDPITHKPVLIVNDNKIFHKSKYYYIPYNTVNYEGLIKCIKPDKVTINKINNQVILGITNNKINIDGIDCILSEEMNL